MSFGLFFYFFVLYVIVRIVIFRMCCMALDDVTDTIFGGPKKLVQFDQSTLRQCFICVNFYIGIIHGCLLICEYGRFKIDHFALFTLSLWYFIFFLLNSYILLVYLLAFYHINRFAATFVSHLIYVHCFPIVIFQRSKLSHVFHWKVPMIRCVLIWSS